MAASNPSLRQKQSQKRSGSRKVRFIVLGAGILAALVLLLWLLPLQAWLRAVLHWTQGLGWWGPIVIALAYVPASVLLLPGTILTMSTGFMLGVFTGTVTALAGSTLGAASAFFLGRTIARDWLAGRLADNQKFLVLNRAVSAQGFKVVLLTRLSPVFPFNVLNYAFGLTGMPFWPYIAASAVGVMPGTLMYVYLGCAARSFAEILAGEVEGGSLEESFFWAGLMITVAIVLYITHVARKALKEDVAEELAEVD